MSNVKTAMIKLHELISEWEFVDIKERYPFVFDLILTKLTEDEIQKERMRYAIDSDLNNKLRILQQQNAEYRKLIKEAGLIMHRHNLFTDMDDYLNRPEVKHILEGK